MICVLCHQAVDLLTLDAEGVAGRPAHDTCATGYRDAAAAALRELELAVMAEPDPRRHRGHLRPTPA